MERARTSLTEEHGFTLIEVMIGIVLLTIGLLAVADVFPRGLALGLYGKDQTKAAGLAQQEVEYLKSQATSTLAPIVGDYASPTAVPTAYFDQNGSPTTLAASYFVRDVQVQYWTWNGTQFVQPATPYTVPTGPYVYRVSVATHWLARGQTVFVKGQAVNGCVNGGVAVPTGLGCVQVSTFISP